MKSIYEMNQITFADGIKIINGLHTDSRIEEVLTLCFEEGSFIRFYYNPADKEHYLFDPEMDGSPIRLTSLVYNSELGLHSTDWLKR